MNHLETLEKYGISSDFRRCFFRALERPEPFRKAPRKAWRVVSRQRSYGLLESTPKGARIVAPGMSISIVLGAVAVVLSVGTAVASGRWRRRHRQIVLVVTRRSKSTAGRATCPISQGSMTPACWTWTGGAEMAGALQFHDGDDEAKAR